MRSAAPAAEASLTASAVLVKRFEITCLFVHFAFHDTQLLAAIGQDYI